MILDFLLFNLASLVLSVLHW